MRSDCVLVVVRAVGSIGRGAQSVNQSIRPHPSLPTQPTKPSLPNHLPTDIPHPNTPKPCMEQIPVRGEDGSWTYLGDGSHKGKQGHMASAVEELQSRFPCTDITRASTVLIDDDRQNIEVGGLGWGGVGWGGVGDMHARTHARMRPSVCLPLCPCVDSRFSSLNPKYVSCVCGGRFLHTQTTPSLACPSVRRR